MDWGSTMNERMIFLIRHGQTQLSDVLSIPFNNAFKIPQNYGCCNIIVLKGSDLNVKIINGSMNCIQAHSVGIKIVDWEENMV